MDSLQQQQQQSLPFSPEQMDTQEEYLDDPFYEQPLDEDIAIEDGTQPQTDSITPGYRYPSPAPTEPEDPDPEYIFDQLATHKIKVNDFGLSPPPPDLPLTPEVFDPYRGLGEFEFRLRQYPRTLPIPGKNLRRLIEIGWLSEEEVKARCSDDDLQGLWDFDERNRVRMLVLIEKEAHQHGNEGQRGIKMGGYRDDGSYPYLTLRYTHVPTMDEREGLANGVRVLYSTVDRVVRMAMAMERERERDRIEGEEARQKIRRLEEEREREKERKEAEKSVGDWVATGGYANTTDNSASAGTIRIPPPAGVSRKRSPHQAWADEEDGGYDEEDSETKRLRLARSQSGVTWNNSQQQQQQQFLQPSQPSQSRPTHSRKVSNPPQPPEKQYPAPLSAYDPELYPDAASAIESQSQSQSQGRPMYRREDTPPAQEQRESGDDEQEEDTRPNALKRPPKKPLKRGLTRGRTLVQIC